MIKGYQAGPSCPVTLQQTSILTMKLEDMDYLYANCFETERFIFFKT